MTIFIIFHCHKQLSWQVPKKALPYKTSMHEWRGKKTFLIKYQSSDGEYATHLQSPLFRLHPKYQPFSVLIAHSSLLQLKCHYRTTTTSFSIPKECFQLSHKYLLLTIHFSYQYYKQLVPKFTNLNGAPISSILNSK